jgi:hypothetical protein
MFYLCVKNSVSERTLPYYFYAMLCGIIMQERELASVQACTHCEGFQAQIDVFTIMGALS